MGAEPPAAADEPVVAMVYLGADVAADVGVAVAGAAVAIAAGVGGSGVDVGDRIAGAGVASWVAVAGTAVDVGVVVELAVGALVGDEASVAAVLATPDTDSSAEVLSPWTRYRCTSVTPSPLSPSAFGLAERSGASCWRKNAA